MASLGKPNSQKTVQEIIADEGLVVIMDPRKVTPHVLYGHVAPVWYANHPKAVIANPVPFYSESGKLIDTLYEPVTTNCIGGQITNGVYHK